MKHMKRTSLLAGLLAGTVMFLVGCGKQDVRLDQGWSPPVKVTESQDGLDGSVDVYKWHDTIILLQERYDWSAKSSTCSVLIRNSDPSNTWTRLSLPDVSRGYLFHLPAMDPVNGRIMFERGYTENDKLLMSAIFVRITGNGGIKVEAERKWTTDQKSLLGETPPNVHINEPGKRGWLNLGAGTANGRDLYIPYCLYGRAYRGNGTEDGPYNNGVFHSTDSGTTWQIERKSDFNAWSPSVCRTRDYCYYFAEKMEMNHGNQLWFTRKPIAGNVWDDPNPIIKSVANAYAIMPQDDTVHLCWADRRHEKRTFDPFHPYRGNLEVAYCQRKDSDATWSKDAILSRGVLFSYSFSMSVEGNKIVVAWAGAQKEHAYAWPYEGDPTDIYFVTSKDGGKTWAEPLKVTDVASDGITSGHPEVAVQNGIIHLFYVQGKEDPHLQTTRQGPWPIYYQQRAFPN
jgi:hypothetical protein